MKNKKGVWITLISVILILGLLASCGTQSPQDALLGTWQNVNEDEQITFYSDGSMVIVDSRFPDEYTWTADEHTIKRTDPVWDTTYIYEYTIQGDTLTMTNTSYDSTYTYKRT